MHHRPLRRAIALSLGVLLALAGTASADRLFADGDVLTPTIEGTKHLGDVAPGAEVSVDIRFVVTCTGVAHVDAGQSVVLTANGGIQPGDGLIVSVTTAVLDPAPGDWAVDGTGCPDPVPSLEGGAFSRVTLRAPTVPGNGYSFTVAWARSFQPIGNGDSSALGPSLTSVNLTMNVVGNIPPRLILPASLTVEGNTANGWTADWSGVSATDPEDAPDPVPTCSPAAGSTLPLGTNPVSCSVADRGGLTATGGFDVTVVDTADPVLAGIPAYSEGITSDPTGTTLAYSTPTATDVVDPSPAVSCVPASGAHVGTGTTTVTCTATDASGNSASDSFDVTVTYRAPHTASATWHDPVDGAGSTFSANHGRTIPIKVRLFVDGAEVTTGSASVKVTPCDGGTGLDLPLTTGGGRWNASLDTSLLVGSCHTVTAWVQGLQAGSFRLELRGAEPARENTSNAAPTSGETQASTSTTKPVKATDTKAQPAKAKPAMSTEPKPAKTGTGKK